jgi:hypothetical protein
MAKTFFFHGQGVGLGGVVTRPFKQSLGAQATASLPITGGIASKQSGKRSIPDPADPKLSSFPLVVSIESEEVEVTGSFDHENGVYRTQISATVTGLNVGDVVTADAVVAKLVSEHHPDEDEPRIDISGSQIVNLQVAGAPVTLTVDTAFFQNLNTYTKFRDKFDRDPGFRKDSRRRFLWGDLQPNEVPDFLAEQYKFTNAQKSLPESKGIVPCSVVKEVMGSKAFQVFSHILVIPNFGKLFLGELLLQKCARRLTMMRFQLGSPVAADLTVSGGDANGSTWP